MSGGHVPPPVAPTGHRHHHPQHHHHHIQHHLQHHLQHHHHPEHHPEHQPSPRAPPTVTCLWVLTPITASISLAIVCIAISTNQWLLTEEKMPNPNYNGTGDNEYLPKSTVSGLWTLCFTNRM
ncbi:hypothetical protein AAG570_011991 [Ranatra chinensis]|uniref:Uncharacterized protein n=1 Tax=Ranatra chinensis TaxID=642074 RepID=A0ABD0YHQ1_9HEMI